jgi:dihydroxyacetone kinase DhaKLM complex PTS-EIIA-like component DhaM
MNSPKKILLDTGNGIHGADLGPRSNQLHSNVSSNLDDHVLVIRELGRRRIWIEFDICRDELLRC